MAYRPPQGGYAPPAPAVPALNLAYITGEISRFEQLASEAGRVPSHFSTLSAAVPVFKTYYLEQRKLFSDISLLQSLDRRLFAVEKWLQAEKARRSSLGSSGAAYGFPSAAAPAGPSVSAAPAVPAVPAAPAAPRPPQTGYVPPSRAPTVPRPAAPQPPAPYAPPSRATGPSVISASPGPSAPSLSAAPSAPAASVYAPQAASALQVTIINPPVPLVLTGESRDWAGSQQKPASRAPLAAGSGAAVRPAGSAGAANPRVTVILAPGVPPPRPERPAPVADFGPSLRQLPSCSPEVPKGPVALGVLASPTGEGDPWSPGFSGVSSASTLPPPPASALAPPLVSAFSPAGMSLSGPVTGLGPQDRDQPTSSLFGPPVPRNHQSVVDTPAPSGASASGVSPAAPAAPEAPRASGFSDFSTDLIDLGGTSVSTSASLPAARQPGVDQAEQTPPPPLSTPPDSAAADVAGIARAAPTGAPGPAGLPANLPAEPLDSLLAGPAADSATGSAASQEAAPVSAVPSVFAPLKPVLPENMDKFFTAAETYDMLSVFGPRLEEHQVRREEGQPANQSVYREVTFPGAE